MKALNKKERREGILKFALVFSVTLTLLFFLGFFTIKTGEKGINILNERHENYKAVFITQATLSHKMENIIKLLHLYKNKNRSLRQHRISQSYISESVDSLETELIRLDYKEEDRFIVFKEMISQVDDIQKTLDRLEADKEELQQLKLYLMKCKEKYNKKENKNQ
ncbi:type VI secretion system TssO [Flagellimonas marinaquae]|uniref:type VI secretion system TssO n=1 Tax=Flagellimonas marinaquae TaxID=254955 RepID=UPI002075D9E7|nr:type VI secretion system TssO [Allomuricauda aquimarina]USD26868.1 type VI secretion system TssO [Allomuricauda aquimarina]